MKPLTKYFNPVVLKPVVRRLLVVLVTALAYGCSVSPATADAPTPTMCQQGAHSQCTITVVRRDHVLASSR